MSTALLRFKNLTAGCLIVCGLLLLGLLAPVIAPHNPYQQDLSATFQAPSAHHWFGTDDFGRDVFSRVLFGARLSLLEISFSVALAVLLGVTLGLIAGYWGGLADQGIMWLMDLLYAFPGIVLMILLVATLGVGLLNSLIAIALFSVPVYCRLTRNLTVTLKRMEFVEAAQSMGAGSWRILIHHILRNAFAPLLIQATVSAGETILTASGLSFLGLGAQPPSAEWGTMLSEGRRFLGMSTHLSFFPGLAITIAAIGFNLLGDGLRDRLDPKF
ncbi:MAG TPA: ABC transporter permease [Bryobacteraceae bacterium]|nr:ABC transporter permease [Bryobacteraceae bacterium]